MTILRLAIPCPLRQLFDYLPPENSDNNQWSQGIRVRVPFGKAERIGILIETASSSEVASEKLKYAISILDQTPPLPQQLINLISWAADYYHYPSGEAIHQALPSLLRKGAACQYSDEEILWCAKEQVSIEQINKSATRQYTTLQLLLKQPQPLSRKELKAQGVQTQTLVALEKKGLVESFAPVQQSTPESILNELPLNLNAEQKNAVAQIKQNEGFSISLLEGVTGSGKTEVYFQLLEKVLKAGRQALILVPEIGLTPQMLQRFKQRFSVTVVALHSGMNDRQRLNVWLKARAGIASIVIGTRSAVFTPLANLGILIVDEEHDTSFKQQDGFRYSARDLAIVRAKNEQIPVILGSATPSLETLYKALNGRYQHVRLTQRAGKSKPPEFELLDIRKSAITAGLSEPLVQAISQHLSNGTQVLVFINRRGFSPTLTCTNCGWICECSRCDVHMTLHKNPPSLHCHHCEKQQPVPMNCPQCQAKQLKPSGVGTERCESRLQQLFPNYPVIRVDRDSTQHKDAMQQIMNKVNSGEPCILTGTQMLAKGHHFPKVTLVAIIDADAGLFSSDFRGMERTAQTILQVAGRAGRASHAGQVIMQTEHIDHPTLINLTTKGYSAFALNELQNRQLTALPPYTHYALIRAEASVKKLAESVLANVRSHIEINSQLPAAVHWIGPFPPPMEKRAGLYRTQLMLYATNRPQLHQLLILVYQFMEHYKKARKVRWSIDVDPVDNN